MAKKRDEGFHTRQCEPQANQRLPKGHFDSDGLSQGRREGAVRPQDDAQQGPRPSTGETK